jgi:hypothetical protein
MASRLKSPPMRKKDGSPIKQGVVSWDIGVDAKFFNGLGSYNPNFKVKWFDTDEVVVAPPHFYHEMVDPVDDNGDIHPDGFLTTRQHRQTFLTNQANKLLGETPKRNRVS